MKLKIEKEAPVAKIYVDRSNTSAGELLETLSGMLETVESPETDKGFRALVLSLACDSKMFTGIENNIRHESVENIRDIIENFPIPVIASVKGVIREIDFMIVIACHLCVAAESARFVPGESFSREIHDGRNLKIAGEEISARDAMQYGIINRTVSDEEVERTSTNMAKRISMLSPIAIGAYLKAINKGSKMSLENALKLEIELFGGMFKSGDVKEGIQAFFEKRKANFTGR